MTRAATDHRPALLWFTRDLRLDDQPALHAAVASGRPVVAAYVLDDQAGGAWSLRGAHRWWLHQSLAALAGELAKRGVTLVLRRGEAATVVAALAEETDAAEVHAAHQIEPAGRDAMARLEQALAPADRALHLHWTNLLFDPDAIRTKGGTPFGVYTPFSNACLARGVDDHLLAAPRTIRAADAPKSESLDDWGLLPTQPNWAGAMAAAWQPGEAGAQARLAGFAADRVAGYADTRNLPGMDGTSSLSPHLHWGEMSPRVAWHAVDGMAGDGAQVFRKELLWREFAAGLLWHNPTMPDAPLRAQYAAMPWRDDAGGLRAWQRGRTGYPIVDAGMRQLWAIGWQHNRVRLITASFLIKHLLIDWTLGEAWFWDTLVDGDLASNSMNWQWVAGCGADASPFFRIFNPVLQGEKFDRAGDYVRQWVPELARLPAPHIHAPWDAPAEVLAEAGVVLGQDYPRPIVGLTEGRDRALAALKRLPKGAATSDGAATSED